MATVQLLPSEALARLVLRTTRRKEMIEWYKTVLGAQALYQNDFIAFMTYDDDVHHRIALAAVPGLVEKPKRSAGLDHLAFFYSTLGAWIANYERLKTLRIIPKVSIHHVDHVAVLSRPRRQRHRPVNR